MFFVSSLLFGQNEDIRKEIEKIIIHDTEINWEKTPDILVSMIDGDSTYHFSFSGFKEDSKVIDENSVFEIGSVSKVFTSSIISVLVDQNILTYESLVNDCLNAEYRNPRLNSLKINDLVTHLSPFPKRPSGFGKKEKDPQNPYLNYTQEDLLEYYKEFVPKVKQEFNYSHVNYALLEQVIEFVTKKPYERILNEYIIGPLDLKNTFVSLSEDKVNSLVEGYDRAGRIARPWSFASFIGSEGLKSSASDLCQFIRANLKESDTFLDQILYENANIERLTNFNNNIYIGKAWHILDHGKKYDVVLHTGKTNGHHCFLAYVKETKTGVVVLSNSALGAEDLGFLVLRMINHNWKRKA